jgi:hypothetical protein
MHWYSGDHDLTSLTVKALHGNAPILTSLPFLYKGVNQMIYMNRTQITENNGSSLTELLDDTGILRRN